MSPNSAFLVIGVASIDGSEKVWVDTIHTTKVRAETRIKKLKEKHEQTPFEFSVVPTHFGHRVAPLYTNAKTDAKGVPDAKVETKQADIKWPEAKDSLTPHDELTNLLRQVICLQRDAQRR